MKKRYRDGVHIFTPPSEEPKDWVLIIDVK
jgi:hypothetical protein